MRNLLFLMAMLFWSFYNSPNIFAQDIHFSSIHASPVHLNPAMTGMFNGGNTRFIGISRSQWNTFTNGFKTISGSIDTKLLHAGSDAFFGGGLQLFTDKAGDLDFKSTFVGGSMSFVKGLSRKSNNYIALGVQAAYYGNSFDQTKMVGFDEETSILFGDVASNINYFDLSVGVGWYYTFNDDNYYYLGASMFHINTPNVSFFDTFNSNQSQANLPGHNLFRKLTIHGGANLRMADNITIQPSFIFFDQGPHREINAGSYFKIQKQKRHRRQTQEYAFYFGAWVRFYQEANYSGIDAVIPSIRADFNNTTISLSFDVNISDLRVVSAGAGGPELSVIKVLGSSNPSRKKSRVKCPGF
ncbi:MAG: PorP/SprF family type IX secretion system membrane protein [Bacteroidia bacterium]|nr:PorP/SprF family type IX secretion system membrane protein [Bacteroidia bacterium]